MIDDLASRRNDVAHGSDVDVVDVATVRAMIKSVEDYVGDVIRQVTRKLLADLLDREAISIGRITHTWKNAETGLRSVAKITNLRQPLRLGQGIYTVAGPTRYAITGIQCDGLGLQQAAPDGRSYGVDLGQIVQEGAELRLLPDTWAAREAVLLRQQTS